MEDRDKTDIEFQNLIFNSKNSKIKAEGINPNAWKHIVTGWDDNLYQEGIDTMFASLSDKRIISLMLSTFEKYPTRGLLNKMKKPTSETEILETKVDLSTPAMKRFAKYLWRSETPSTYDIQQSILAEVKFLGAMSLSKNWNTFVVWYVVTEEDHISELDETLNGNGSYISAIVFPNNNQEPRSVIYPTHRSKEQLKEFANTMQHTFDETMLGLSKTQKVVMMNFGQVNGSASYFNDPEFATESWSMKKKKIQINTIQQRFAYVRQYLCGLSQNKLAFWLSEQGISIDNKGIKYWEEKETDEPSFVKNHWKDVLKVFTEHSYYLLQLRLSNAYYRENKKYLLIDWRPLTNSEIMSFLNDFILFGNEFEERFPTPDIILQTTDMKIKDQKDLLWERASLRRLTSDLQGKGLTEKQVLEDSGYLKQWINLFIEMKESEILDDLDKKFGDESTKKEVYYLWHKANELYKPKTKKTSTKTKKGQIDPPF
jgi:hypothetical protein